MRVRTQKVLEIPFGIPYLAYYLIAELHNKIEATFFFTTYPLTKKCLDQGPHLITGSVDFSRIVKRS